MLVFALSDQWYSKWVTILAVIKQCCSISEKPHVSFSTAPKVAQ